MNSKLSHLDSGQLIELMKRYYEDGEKIADLISDFELNVQPSMLVGLFPPHVCDDQSCPYCDEQKLVSKRMSRDHGAWAIGAPICPLCNHSEQGYCRCKNCLEHEAYIQQNSELKKQLIIQNRYGEFRKSVPSARALTLRDAVYLLSVSRHSLSEDFYSVSPFSENLTSLAPTYEFQSEIVQHLYTKGIITISSESDLNAFEFDEELTETDAYYPTRVIWEFLPSMTDGEKRIYLKDVEALAKSGDWVEKWKADEASLWQLVAKYECFEYYSYLLSQRGYDREEYGPKTHSVFETLLETYSVSQVFNLSWQAVRDTTDYIVRESLPRYHAKNSFIGAIQRKADKATAEGWEIKCSRRDFKCPQTVLSSTFFDVFLELGQAAFDSPPPPPGS